MTELGTFVEYQLFSANAVNYWQCLSDGVRGKLAYVGRADWEATA